MHEFLRNLDAGMLFGLFGLAGLAAIAGLYGLVNFFTRRQS